MRRPTVDYLTRYEADPASGCWDYTGSISKRGYGQIGGGTFAHRYFYMRLVGPIPSGMVLDHLCSNKRCVNPDHLEPVTQKENVKRWRAEYKPLCSRCKGELHQT